jgi:hypothetical protein
MSGVSRLRLVLLVVLVVAGPLLFVWWSRHEPLPSPAEGERIVVSTAQRGGEHRGVTASCRHIGKDEDVLGCRLRDDRGRYGWGEVSIGTRKVEGYRGAERHEVVQSRADFPLSSDGVAEIDFRNPGSEAGLEVALLVVLRDSLSAAGYDWYVWPSCPPLAPGETVRCELPGLPATVDLTRGDGEDHHVRLEITPRP